MGKRIITYEKSLILPVQNIIFDNSSPAYTIKYIHVPTDDQKGEYLSLKMYNSSAETQLVLDLMDQTDLEGSYKNKKLAKSTYTMGVGELISYIFSDIGGMEEIVLRAYNTTELSGAGSFIFLIKAYMVYKVYKDYDDILP